MPRGTPLAVDIHYSGTIDDRLQNNTVEWSVVDTTRKKKSLRTPVIIKSSGSKVNKPSHDLVVNLDTDFPELPIKAQNTKPCATKDSEPTIESIIDEYRVIQNTDAIHFEPEDNEHLDMCEIQLAFENDFGWYVNCDNCGMNRHTHPTDEICQCRQKMIRTVHYC